jgi:hypothetical protein
MSRADGNRSETGMKTLFHPFLWAAAFVLLGSLAHGSVFSDRMDRVRPGMAASRMIRILGQPSSVSTGAGGISYFHYATKEGTWQVAVSRGQVVRIDEP